MPESPLVSILIPAYNYAHLLPRTLRSVFEQSYRPIEVIVVDDGSTDATAEVLAATSGITAVRQPNRGLSAARNEAIRRASGKYLQFLDADDLLGRRAIARRVALLEAHPECPAAICRSSLFSRFVLPEPLAWMGREWRHPIGGRPDLALRYRNIAPVHAFLVRAQALQRNRIAFDETLRAVEDYDFWLRLFNQAGPPCLLRKGWVYYRQHAGSMSKDLRTQTWHDLQVFRRLWLMETQLRQAQGLAARADHTVSLLRGASEVARKLWRWQPADHDDFVTRCMHELLGLVEQCMRDGVLSTQGWLILSAVRQDMLDARRRSAELGDGIFQPFAARLGYHRCFFLRARRVSRARDLRMLARIAVRDLKYAVCLALDSRSRQVVEAS